MDKCGCGCASLIIIYAFENIDAEVKIYSF